jgi:uncharacterized protein
MQTLLEQIIADFHERQLPEFTRRQTKLPFLSNKIDTVIGMRRSGKTWYLYQVISDLLEKGTSVEQILYLNLEDERLLPIAPSDLHLIPETYYRRYPKLKDETCYFFFDEIQNIDKWETFVRRLFDTENIHLCLSGSSSRLLSREIATNLRGRSLSTEIFPFSFAESLSHSKIEVEKGRRPGSKKTAILQNAFNQYLLTGGFPEVQGAEATYRDRILQDYLDIVILRDLVERHQISNTVPLRYLIRHILNAAAGLFSVNKFYNDLKSQGISCSKNTLHEYLGYLTEAYLAFQVPIHTRSERARMVNPRKIYAIDTGLVRSCSHSASPNWGHLLENFVYLVLRRQTEAIEYYKTNNGYEIDFLVTDPEGVRHLIQVSANLSDPATREREIRALVQSMDETKLIQSLIITLNQEETIETKSGTIYMLPAWLWASSMHCALRPDL